MPATNAIGIIRSIKPGTVGLDRAAQLIGHYCEILATIHTSVHNAPYQGYELYMVTGPCRTGTTTLSAVHVELLDLPKEVKANRLCCCKGLAHIHSPRETGCLSTEASPFCGMCGMPCTIIQLPDGISGEMNGVPFNETFDVDVSLCCQTSDLFTDCNLTKRTDEPRILP